MTRAALLVPVFAGGALGGLARVGLSELFGSPAGSWPWATFIANLAGAMILGATYEALREPRSAHTRLFLGTGFCGGLTTFSTLQVELLDLVNASEPTLALLYGAASVGGGLAAAFAGALAARRFPGVEGAWEPAEAAAESESR